jgi:hypothetical protein
VCGQGPEAHIFHECCHVNVSAIKRELLVIDNVVLQADVVAIDLESEKESKYRTEGDKKKVSNRAVRTITVPCVRKLICCSLVNRVSLFCTFLKSRFRRAPHFYSVLKGNTDDKSHLTKKTPNNKRPTMNNNKNVHFCPA